MSEAVIYAVTKHGRHKIAATTRAEVDVYLDQPDHSGRPRRETTLRIDVVETRTIWRQK